MGTMLATNATMSLDEMFHRTSPSDQMESIRQLGMFTTQSKKCYFLTDEYAEDATFGTPLPEGGHALHRRMFQEMIAFAGRLKRWGLLPRNEFPMPKGFELFEPPHGTVASLKSG